MLDIDPEFAAIIPPLTKEEYEGLKQDIIRDGCIRVPIDIWDNVPESMDCKYCYKDNVEIIPGDGVWECAECGSGLADWDTFKTIVDGHNRYKIAQELDIDYEINELEFESREEAMIWMIDNQRHRRNLTDGWKIELALKRKELLLEKGKEVHKETVGRPTIEESLNKSLLINNNDNDKKDKKYNTRNEISNIAGVSTGKVAQAEVIKKQSPEVWEKVKAGEQTVGGAYKEVKKEEKKKEVEKKVSELKNKETKPITDKYDVIVIDPPWEMEKIERDVAPNQIGFDYPTMTIDEIKELNLLYEKDCHFFLWTTQKYLPLSFELFKHWDIKYVLTMVWHKNGGFQPFNLPQYNCEFILYGRIGSPIFIDTKQFNTCFQADRTGHSQKPEIFYDLLQRVTAGKRLDMFGRRNIKGFDSWGNEVE